MKSRLRAAGFTLIELMVTLAVVAILATLAAPSFIDAIDRTRLKSQVTGVVDLLEFAKSEAMKRSTVAIAIAGGSAWSVTVSSTDLDGNVEQKSISYDATNGAVLNSPTSATLAMNFRGVVTGTGVDTPIVIQSRRGVQAQIVVNPIGRVTVCGVGGAFGGYPSCGT